jgi:hypothetical protein
MALALSPPPEMLSTPHVSSLQPGGEQPRPTVVCLASMQMSYLPTEVTLQGPGSSLTLASPFQPAPLSIAWTEQRLPSIPQHQQDSLWNPRPLFTHSQPPAQQVLWNLGLLKGS